MAMSPSGQRIDGVAVAKARLAIIDRSTGKALTQAAFARRLGIHVVTMSNIENSKANVSLELLEKIAKETRKRREDFQLADSEDSEEAALPMGDHRQMLAALYDALGIALKNATPAASPAKATAGATSTGG